MKFRAIYFFFFFQSVFAFAQDTIRTASVASPTNEETNILFRNEAAGGINIHSNGFGITFKRGWHMTGYKKQMLDIDIVSMRHPKQVKRANPYYTESRPFFYGKLNFVYIIRGGYGRQNILFSKAERSGVEVRYNYCIGADLGLTKPVYLQVLVDPDSVGLETRKYDPDDPDQQAVENIYGPGNYFKGFNELSLYPGGYAKFALSFEYAGWQQKVTAIEAGMVVDYFPIKGIPIMAHRKADKLFFNFLYLTDLGRKVVVQNVVISEE